MNSELQSKDKLDFTPGAVGQPSSSHTLPLRSANVYGASDTEDALLCPVYRRTQNRCGTALMDSPVKVGKQVPNK